MERMELQCLKRNKPSQLFAQGSLLGSASGSCSSLGGIFGLSSPEKKAPSDGRKRRKQDKNTWVNHTLTPYFDGHLWRKYGQKVIKDAPYPRLYFRCSYREDRHCLASKLVQQVTHDDMPVYEVTYMNEHTCNAEPVPAPDVVADAVPAATSGPELVLRFDSAASSGGGGNHRGAGMKLQERQQYYRAAVLQPSPFLMMNFDDLNGSQLHAFPSHVLPPAGPSSLPFPIMESSSPPTSTTTSWSSSFPIIDSSPTAPSTDNEDGLFSTFDWDSFTNDLDGHSHFRDHVQFEGNTSSWETDGSLLAHLLKGIEEEGVF